MSWIQKLYETYERCADAPQFEKSPLNPVSTLYQDTQIEVALDGTGRFLRAEISELKDTLIPVSEKSATRAGNEPSPHALTDKLRYCAPDLAAFGGDGGRYARYHKQLEEWCASKYCDPKASAVLRYLEQGTLVGDLVKSKVMKIEDGKLARIKAGSGTPIAAEEAWVRWKVEIDGEAQSKTWEDRDLLKRWALFEDSPPRQQGICMATGATVRTAKTHPRGIRRNADRAKLISSNDHNGFTFRGRLRVPEEAAGAGYETSQKAHNALRWLIKRQGTRVGEQVYVAWDVGGAEIPAAQASTAELLGLEAVNEKPPSYGGDAGQLLALRLGQKLKGYRAILENTSGVVVMGLDTAAEGTGRLAITYYRELSGSEYLDRIEQWHLSYAWLLPLIEADNGQGTAGKRMRFFVGAPAPKTIAEAAYGRRVEGKRGKRLLYATIERLIPCIVDGRPIPSDLIIACVRRTVNRMGLRKSRDKKDRDVEWEWEKCLGIACALIRGGRGKEDYQMSLEENRTTRDYLFGRLLAIAENIEQRALHLANEKRDTNAAKLMQRFADRPCSTWRNIEVALAPHRTRLRANRPGVLLEREKLLDEITGKFRIEDFTSDHKLSGEFLLGYHCQRAALWQKTDKDESSEPKSEKEDQGENS